MKNEREDRWQHLVAGAFALTEGSAAKDPLGVQRYLESVLEVFPAGIDPLEDFEGFAVRRMALALLTSLPSSGDTLSQPAPGGT